MAPPNYIDRHGNVGGSKTIFRQITDLFFGIINFVALFFTAVSNPAQRISESRSTYGHRNQGQSYSRQNGNGGRRGGASNVRGIKNLGAASIQGGGG